MTWCDSGVADTHRYWLLTQTDDEPFVVGWTNDAEHARRWSDYGTVIDRELVPVPPFKGIVVASDDPTKLGQTP